MQHFLSILITFSVIMATATSWADCPDGIQPNLQNWTILNSEEDEHISHILKSATINLPALKLGEAQINCLDIDDLTDPHHVRTIIVNKLIANAEAILKRQYDPEWHSLVDDILKHAKNIWLGISEAPSLMIIPGHYGYGKTLIFKDAAKALGVSKDSQAYVVTKSDIRFPIQKILDLGIPDGTKYPPLRIFNLSEVLEATPIDQLHTLKDRDEKQMAYTLGIVYEWESRTTSVEDGTTSGLTKEEKQRANAIYRARSIERANNAFGGGHFVQENSLVATEAEEALEQIMTVLNKKWRSAQAIQQRDTDPEEEIIDEDDPDNHTDALDQQEQLKIRLRDRNFELKQFLLSDKVRSTLSDEITNYYDGDQSTIDTIEEKLKVIFTKYPVALNGFNTNKLKKLAREFFTEYMKERQSNPDAGSEIKPPFYQKIVANMEDFSGQTQNINHIIIAIDFNPDELLERAIRSAGNRGIDALRAEVEALTTPEALYQEWVKVWGENPKLVSRLGLRSLKMLLPYSKEQWREFFKHRFKNIAFLISERIKNTIIGNDIEITVDDSVIETFVDFYADLSDNGLRPFFNNGQKILNSLFNGIEKHAIKNRKTFADKKLHYEFSVNEKNMLQAFLHDPNNDSAEQNDGTTEGEDDSTNELIFIAEEQLYKIETSATESNETGDEQNQKNLQRFHQTANFIIATRILGSVPTQLSPETNFGTTMFNNGWDIKSTPSNFARENLIALLSVASRTALRDFDQLAFVPNEIEDDNKILWTSINNIIKYTFKMLELYGYKKEDIYREYSANNSSGKLSERNPFVDRIAEGIVRPATPVQEATTDTSTDESQEVTADGVEIEAAAMENTKDRNDFIKRVSNMFAKKTSESILPTQIFSPEFFDAILRIDDPALKNNRKENFLSAVRILMDKASRILGEEKMLFQEVYKALGQDEALEAPQLLELVETHMTSDPTRELITASEPGSIHAIANADIETLVTESAAEPEVVEEIVEKNRSGFWRFAGKLAFRGLLTVGAIFAGTETAHGVAVNSYNDRPAIYRSVGDLATAMKNSTAHIVFEGASTKAILTPRQPRLVKNSCRAMLQ